MTRTLVLVLTLGLAACGVSSEADRAEVAEFVVFRSDDGTRVDRAFRIKLNGEVAGDLRPGEALRYGVPAGEFTLTAETAPKRFPLSLGFDFAPFERASKRFNMRPGRQVVVEVQPGVLGGPLLIERRRARVVP